MRGLIQLLAEKKKRKCPKGQRYNRTTKQCEIKGPYSWWGLGFRGDGGKQALPADGGNGTPPTNGGGNGNGGTPPMMGGGSD